MKPRAGKDKPDEEVIILEKAERRCDSLQLAESDFFLIIKVGW